MPHPTKGYTHIVWQDLDFDEVVPVAPAYSESEAQEIVRLLNEEIRCMIHDCGIRDYGIDEDYVFFYSDLDGNYVDPLDGPMMLEDDVARPEGGLVFAWSEDYLATGIAKAADAGQAHMFYRKFICLRSKDELQLLERIYRNGAYTAPFPAEWTSPPSKKAAPYTHIVWHCYTLSWDPVVRTRSEAEAQTIVRLLNEETRCVMQDCEIRAYHWDRLNQFFYTDSAGRYRSEETGRLCRLPKCIMKPKGRDLVFSWPKDDCRASGIVEAEHHGHAYDFYRKFICLRSKDELQLLARIYRNRDYNAPFPDKWTAPLPPAPPPPAKKPPGRTHIVWVCTPFGTSAYAPAESEAEAEAMVELLQEEADNVALLCPARNYDSDESDSFFHTDLDGNYTNDKGVVDKLEDQDVHPEGGLCFDAAEELCSGIAQAEEAGCEREFYRDFIQYLTADERRLLRRIYTGGDYKEPFPDHWKLPPPPSPENSAPNENA